MLTNIKIAGLFFLFFYSTCKPTTKQEAQNPVVIEEEQTVNSAIKTGAARIQLYLDLIKNKNLALVVNQTSMIDDQHLVDTLLSLNIQIKKIFAPEHGFRGTADAGEKIQDGKDPSTGIPLISLYGKKKKPGKDDLEGIEMLVFDIQDVGARFYTYISSMHYVMEACAENDIPILILDRPNPNGHYVDGPILKKEYKSFIGMHPVPVVHGMTVAEYAMMINEEGWLEGGKKCRLQYIKCENYDHNTFYELPVKPSPNLPDMRAIYLYPSLCFFEGTKVNVGRGTNKQFQIYGHPDYKGGDYSYIPRSLPGAKNPKHKGETCYGYDLSTLDPSKIREERKINLSYLINYYKTFPKDKSFFREDGFFNLLAGNEELRAQIESGMSEDQIKESWKDGIVDFKKIREKIFALQGF